MSNSAHQATGSPPAGGDTPNTDDTVASSHLSGDMLTAHLLAMLQDWTAYGYELVQKLNEAGFGRYNTGTVYRALRQMERLGLVSSSWGASPAGPDRRMYAMTAAGVTFLRHWLQLIDIHRAALEQLRNGFGGREPGRRLPSIM